MPMSRHRARNGSNFLATANLRGQAVPLSEHSEDGVALMRFFPCV